MAIDLLKQMANRDTEENTRPGALYNTPNLDELENGPWPSFVTGLKRLANDTHEGAPMIRDVLGTLETSYVTKTGYWKGGTVGVIGYGGGVIPRFNELKMRKVTINSLLLPNFILLEFNHLQVCTTHLLFLEICVICLPITGVLD